MKFYWFGTPFVLVFYKSFIWIFLGFCLDLPKRYFDEGIEVESSKSFS